MVFTLTFLRETAICRGAVLKALTNTSLPCVRVSSRISRLSYGVCNYEKFVQGHHNEEDRKFYAIRGYDEAVNQMTWMLRKVGLRKAILHVITM